MPSAHTNAWKHNEIVHHAKVIGLQKVPMALLAFRTVDRVHSSGQPTRNESSEAVTVMTVMTVMAVTTDSAVQIMAAYRIS